MDEPKRLTLQRQLTMQTAGLVVMLDKAGGSIRFTEADHAVVLAKHGGKTRLVIHTEVLREMGRADSVEISLQRREPRNAELPS